MRASFTRRALALCIDATMIFALTAVGAAVIASAGAGIAGGVRLGELLLFLPWFCYTMPEFLWGMTLGKWLLGIRIGGQPAVLTSRWRLFLRWSTKHYGFVVGLISLCIPSAAWAEVEGLSSWVVAVGCIAALNDDRLAWHDQWAGTAVWRERRPPPLPVPLAAP